MDLTLIPLLSTLYVLGTVLSAMNILTHLIIAAPLEVGTIISSFDR